MEIAVHRHRATPVKNACVAFVHTICLFSNLNSSLFCLDHEVHVGTNLCWWYACFLPKSERLATSSQSKHWSVDCPVYQTCSASPVREKWMCKWNGTVEVFKVQSSYFKKLTKNVGWPRPPQPLRFWYPCGLGTRQHNRKQWTNSTTLAKGIIGSL